MVYGVEETMAQASSLQTQLQAAYNEAEKTGLSWFERRAIDQKIRRLEEQLDAVLQNQAQASTPGGVYTPEGTKPITSGVVIDQPALVLGSKQTERKRSALPFVAIAAAGIAAYFTFKG